MALILPVALISDLLDAGKPVMLGSGPFEHNGVVDIGHEFHA